MATRAEIRELARNDAVLHNAVTAFDVGAMTWEEAMNAALVAYSQMARELMEQNRKLLNGAPVTIYAQLPELPAETGCCGL